VQILQFLGVVCVSQHEAPFLSWSQRQQSDILEGSYDLVQGLEVIHHPPPPPPPGGGTARPRRCLEGRGWLQNE
jgi:hypothetical protein